VDIAVTVLHPTHRGLLSYFGHEAAWRLVRWLSRITSRRQLLSMAGPVAMATSFLTRVGVLWVGFALIYPPQLDRLNFNPPVPVAARNLADALHLSAVSLSTIGFGTWWPPGTCCGWSPRSRAAPAWP
jgi:hypothetical protein